jgi:Protein of unknown function (DUF3365)
MSRRADYGIAGDGNCIVSGKIGCLVTVKLQSKPPLVFGSVLVTAYAVVQSGSYRDVHEQMPEGMRREAQEIRAILMATRRVYHHQFVESGLSFSNVSDHPRNPTDQADLIELEAMEYFRAN